MTDFVATVEMSRDPWMLLDNLWSHLSEEDRIRLPEDLREAVEEVIR